MKVKDFYMIVPLQTFGLTISFIKKKKIMPPPIHTIVVVDNPAFPK